MIGGYIEGEMIQYLQFTQDVPTGFQDTSPPVTAVRGWSKWRFIDESTKNFTEVTCMIT